MRDGSWGQAGHEVIKELWATALSLVRRAMAHLSMTLGLFLALAMPFIVLLLVLWYLESTGYRPEAGFYKIGALCTAIARA